MKTGKLVGMGCSGKSETFGRFWEKMVTDLAQQAVTPQFKVSFACDDRYSAGLHMDRNRQVIINVCLPRRKKSVGLPIPELSLVRCEK